MEYREIIAYLPSVSGRIANIRITFALLCSDGYNASVSIPGPGQQEEIWLQVSGTMPLHV
jgi:hypothetical protein